MNLQIVTDSGCDLTPEQCAEYGIRVVPIVIILDGVEYREGIDITKEEALRKITTCKAAPASSQPAPGEFIRVFDELIDQGPVLYLGFSSKLSGTYNSARLAADQCKNTVTTYDTLLGSFAQGFQVLTAAKMAKQGKTAEEVLEVLKAGYEQSGALIILEEMDGAIKSGRLSKIQGMLAKTLNIKSIITLCEGRMDVTEKIRGAAKLHSKAMEMLSQIKLDFSKTAVGIVHFNALGQAEEYRKFIQDKWQPKSISINHICTAFGAYSGETAIVVSYGPSPDLV